MNTSASHINRILVEEDIEGYIDFGAPEDEYDTEAVQISEAIMQLRPDQMTSENVLSIISLIWLENFEL